MEKLSWQTKKVKVKDLIPLGINPRKISEQKKQKLIASIEKFNLAEIPAVNADLTILGGNQRVLALLLMDRGEEEIDVRFPSRPLTELEAKEYTIISNVHAGEFDFEILDLEFGDINFDDLGFQIDGLAEFNLAKNKALAAEAHEDDFEVPIDGLETDIVEGDLFEIGSHKLLCGSSLTIDNWKKLLGDEMIDLVITDPPYNVNYTGSTKEALKIKNDSMSDGAFYQFLFDFYTAAGTHTKAGGVWYVWHADTEGMNFRKAMADAGISVRQCLIWVKNSMVMGRQDYHWRHEPCLYGWKEGGKHGWYSDRKQTTVLNFDRPQRNAEHSTMKPVELIAYQMSNSSKQDDIVADGFGGSGTTMVAAQQLKRRCRMCELDPRYCQVIVERMHKLEPTLLILKNGEPWVNTAKNS